MSFITEIKEDQILLKENDETLCWLKVLTDIKTLSPVAGVTRLSISEFTGMAQIAVVLTIFANHARIVSSGLVQFDVRTNFLGNGCRVFS